MSNQLSNVQVIGIAEQTAKGSVNTTPDWFLKYLEGDMPTEMDKTLHREGDNDEHIAIAIKNAHRERFSFKVLARPEITAVLWAYHLGKDVVTGASDPYTHTLTRSATNGRAWLTIAQEYESGKVRYLADCKIDKITAEGETGKSVMLTIEGTGITVSFASTSLTPVYDDEEPYRFYDAAGAFTLKSGVTRRINKFSVVSTITSAELQTDEVSLNDIADLKHDVDVTADLFAQDGDTNWKDINYNAGSVIAEDLKTGNMIVDFTRETGTREFKITVGKIVFEPVALPQKADAEVNTETIAGPAIVPDSGEFIQVVCKNAISANLLNNS